MRERERENEREIKQSMLWIRHVELNPLTTDPAKVTACSSAEFFSQRRHLGENLTSAAVLHRKTETYFWKNTETRKIIGISSPANIGCIRINNILRLLLASRKL